MKAIREKYNVPAYRGTRVRYLGGGEPKEGVIISAKGGKLRISCDDGLRLYLHPDYQVQYLDDRGLVMDDRTDIVPARPHDGEFKTYSQWVSRARSWLGGTRAVTFDAKNRKCRIGKDFMLADAEGAFPVRFWFMEACS